MEPILINRYMRKYFLSADRNFRITLDWQMSFYRFHALNNAFMGRISLMDQMVIELKYAADQNLDPSEVTRFFPFRHTRNSKYIVGMDLTA
jgi:hypothetical protein